MKLENRQLQDLLAGEYVLGTLRGPARDRFERYLQDSSELQQAVAFWETALAPLARCPAQEPPPQLLTAIEKRLGWHPAPQAGGWKLPWLPSLAFALVAAFSVLLWAPWEARLVPDFSVNVATEDGALQLQAAIDRTHNWIDLRLVSRPPLSSDRDLELWLLVEGEAPVSLGLLPEHDGSVQRIEARVSLARAQGLAVTVEPAGGSPTGAPTTAPIAVQLFPTT